MAVENNVFPQSGDADFAENFATWLGRGNISDYVETGLNFTVDYASSPPTTAITEGKSYVIINETTISSNDETRLLLDYAITTDSVASLSLNADEENNLVYLNPNLGTNDSPSFEVETAAGNAGASWLLIGVIDTVNNTVEKRNRNPDADFDNISSRESLDIPTYSEFSEASASESSTIYIDGNGGPDAGIYVHNGSSFISSGVREINKLLDVDGVESVQSATLSNRPASGTQGSLFIDETNNRIQIDTGSAWVDIGTNAGNIGPSDLGFDPATQSELDTHAGDSDVHHTRPSAGNGLKDQTNTFNIEPSEFVGSFLSDNSDNIDVQIGFGLEDDGSGQIQFDEGASYTFPNQQIINGTLTMGADIDLSNNNLVEPNQLQTSGSGSDTITVQDTYNATPILTLSEGGEVAVTSGDLTNGGTTTIYDQSASHVPLATLEHDSVTINANDGLKSGGVVTLGGSVGLDIEPADFAGSYLSDDGADNLQVNLGTGVESDGTDNIRVDENYDFTFTSPIDFSAGLDTQGDISDGTQVIWDVSAQEIPDSALGSIANATLTNSSVTINAGDNLTGGGSLALGESLTLNSVDTRADISDSGTAVTTDVTDINFDSNVQVTDDGDGSVTIDAAGNTDTTTDVSEDGTTVVSQVSDINFSSNVNVTDDGDGTVTVSSVDTDTRTDVSLGDTLVESNVTDIAFTGPVQIGSSSGDSDVTVNIQTQTFSDNTSTVLTDPDDINFGTGISVSDDGDDTITVDGTTYTAGNALTLDGTEFNVSEQSIDHSNLAGIGSSDHHSRYSDSEARTAIANGPFILENRTDRPSSPSTGRVIFRTDK